MGDLLQALYKERRTVSDRVVIMQSYIEQPNEYKSKTPYTDDDLKREQRRLEEVNVAIAAIVQFRKQI